MSATLTQVKERRWEAEELELVCSVPRGGDVVSLRQKLHRSYDTIATKRREFWIAQRQRAACAAFLPDTGMPFRALMARIRREAKPL